MTIAVIHPDDEEAARFLEEMLLRLDREHADSDFEEYRIRGALTESDIKKWEAAGFIIGRGYPAWLDLRQRMGLPWPSWFHRNIEFGFRKRDFAPRGN